MPTYEYMCVNCGRFEEFQSIKAAPLDACPKCGGLVTRLISAGGGMIFKGSGFYETDYRKPEYRKQAKEEGGALFNPGGKTLAPGTAIITVTSPNSSTRDITLTITE